MRWNDDADLGLRAASAIIPDIRFLPAHGGPH